MPLPLAVPIAMAAGSALLGAAKDDEASTPAPKPAPPSRPGPPVSDEVSRLFMSRYGRLPPGLGEQAFMAGQPTAPPASMQKSPEQQAAEAQRVRDMIAGAKKIGGLFEKEPEGVDESGIDRSGVV